MKIGTRSSAMAMAQTNLVAATLRNAHAGLGVDVVQFKPHGDRDQTSRLEVHGGKGGAFVAEIRDAIRGGALQAAMHSLKDMPGDEQTPGLVIGAVLARDATQDALILRNDHAIEDFITNKAAGLKIGTNSVRRAAYLQKLYPDAQIIHYRGAVDTRLKKLDEKILQKLPDGGETGPADAIMAARSGLERLGLADRISHIFSTEIMPPAIGQGVIAVECAENDWATREKLAAIDHAPTRLCMEAEREMLWILNGHCNAPIAGLATLQGEKITLYGAVLSEDGDSIIETRAQGPAERPRELGRAVGLTLMEKGAGALIAASRL